MIRAGRRVYTLENLAELHGMALGTFKNKKPHRKPGFPEPVSAPGARVLLWDADQVDAHLAGEPIPALPTEDDPEDLFSVQEAGALLDPPVSPKSWDVYRRDPALRAAAVMVGGKVERQVVDGVEREVVVGGVEHHPRRAILDWDASRPGLGTGGGRPVGSKDTRPRDRSNDPRMPAIAARKDRIRKMLEDSNGQVTAGEVAAAEGISERQALRDLNEVRKTTG